MTTYNPDLYPDEPGYIRFQAWDAACKAEGRVITHDYLGRELDVRGALTNPGNWTPKEGAGLVKLTVGGPGSLIEWNGSFGIAGVAGETNPAYGCTCQVLRDGAVIYSLPIPGTGRTVKAQFNPGETLEVRLVDGPAQPFWLQWA